jgi:hypothetical protein
VYAVEMYLFVFKLTVEGLQHTSLKLVTRYTVGVLDTDKSVIEVFFHFFFSASNNVRNSSSILGDFQNTECIVDSFRAGPGWNCSSILVLLESCLRTCMTHTIAECTVNKFLMMDRGNIRNI